jgi:hypothetical protein
MKMLNKMALKFADNVKFCAIHEIKEYKNNRKKRNI